MKKRSKLPKKVLKRETRAVVAILIALFLLVCFSSCASTYKVSTTLSELEANQLIANLKQAKKEFSSFRGLGKLSIHGSGHSKITKVAWLGLGPGNLRCEILGLWGQSMATLLVEDNDFYLYVVKKNVCYKGKSSAKNLLKILRIPISGKNLVSIMAGQPPILPFQKARVHIQKSDVPYRALSLYGRWNKIIQKIWFIDDNKSVERTVVFNKFGDVKLSIEFGDFNEKLKKLFPHRIQLSEPDGFRLLLNVEKFESPVNIPKNAFKLILKSAKVVDLG